MELIVISSEYTSPLDQDAGYMYPAMFPGLYIA
jgi:hypothetical protein